MLCLCCLPLLCALTERGPAADYAQVLIVGLTIAELVLQQCQLRFPRDAAATTAD